MPRPAKSYDRLSGKVAIVTGAGSEGIGIGKATALLMGAEGARVCVADIDRARAEATADEIKAAGNDAVAVAGDVGLLDDCRRIVEQAVGVFGGVDILVNNAGISPSNPLTDFDAEVYQRVMDVNLRGAVALSAAVIPHMAKRGGGAIVNVSSIAGMQGYGTISYGAAKAGMYSLARDITASHGRQGIRANVIAPGHLQTSHVEGMMSAEMRAMRRRVGPLGTEGDSWDVARAAVFLASDDARFITGTIVPVDGGVTAIGPLVGYGLLMRGD